MMSLHPKKESRFSRKLETLLWWILKLLPFIIYLFYVWGFFKNPTLVDGIIQDGDSFFFSCFSVGLDFSSFMSHLFDAFYNNIVFSVLNDIFYFNGILPFGFSWLYYYAVYFVFVEILRIILDVILFIPRLARKWINMACQVD